MDLNNDMLTRRGFLALTGATSLGAFLAACGGGRRRRRVGGDGYRDRDGRRTGHGLLRPRLRAGRAHHVLRVGRVRQDLALDVGDLHQGRVREEEPAQVRVPRERHPGARQGGVGLQPRCHPSLHRLLAGLPRSRPDPAVRHVAAPRLRGHPRGDSRAGRGRRRARVPRPVRHRVLVPHVSGRQDPDHDRGGVLEPPARLGVRGEARDLLGPHHDHQDRRAHQRRRADRPEQAHVRADRGGEGDDDPGEAADPELLERQPGQHQRLHQRQRLGDLHVAGRLPPGHSPQEPEGRRRPLHVAEGGPPRLGLRFRAPRADRAAGPSDARRRGGEHAQGRCLAHRCLRLRRRRSRRACWS